MAYPLIIAHRGLHTQHPENSLAAIRAAAEQGIPAVEFDLRRTRDGRFVVHHDARFFGQRIPIAQRSLGEWQRRLGRNILTFSTLLQHVPAKLHLCVEVKDRDADALRVVEMLRLSGAWKRSTILSFHPEVLRQLGAVPIDRWLLISVHPAFRLRYPSVLLNPFRVAAALGCSAVAPHYTFVGRRFLANARRAGLHVVPWTVNHPSVGERLATHGVAAIISDDPLALRAAFHIS